MIHGDTKTLIWLDEINQLTKSNIWQRDKSNKKKCFLFSPEQRNVCFSLQSVPLPIDPSANQISESYPSYYIQYRIDKTHHYRPSLVSFLHQQPDGSQLPTVRYYRIVFHCDILPGSLYLRFSRRKPYRTVLLNRRDPSSTLNSFFFVLVSRWKCFHCFLCFSYLRLSISRRL